MPVKLTLPPGPNVAFLIYDIYSRPHGVASCVPILIMKVDQDGKLKALFFGSSLDQRDVALCRSFWSLDSDNADASARQALLPAIVVIKICNAVMALKGIEVN